MEKTYYIDNYLREMECTVTEVVDTDKGTQVKTDKTIFYPECGGQPGDKGKLGMFDVLDTKKADNGDSILIMPKGCKVQVGMKLTLALDWEHRYKYMIMHTAQHMTSGMLFNLFNIGTVSVHLGDDYLTIETNQEEIAKDKIDTLIREENKAIREGHRIIYHEMSHSDAEQLGLRRSIKVDGDVRIVEIKGVDRIACGGVHVANTSEIGLISYLGQEQVRGHVRLFLQCENKAVDTMIDNERVLSDLRSSLSCGNNEIKLVVNKLNEELYTLKQKYMAVAPKLAAIELADKVENDVAVFETDLDISSLVEASNKYSDLAMCAVSDYLWAIVLKGRFSGIDFSKIRNSLLPVVDAKGGGRSPLFQGKCTKTDKASIEAFFKGFKEIVS